MIEVIVCDREKNVENRNTGRAVISCVAGECCNESVMVGDVSLFEMLGMIKTIVRHVRSAGKDDFEIDKDIVDLGIAMTIAEILEELKCEGMKR